MSEEIMAEETLGENQESTMPVDDQKSSENSGTDGIPEEVSERTKDQFNKLLDKNRELADKLKSLESQESPSESVLDILRNQASDQSPAADPADFVDSNTGYVDIQRLQAAIKLAETKAAKAEQEVRSFREEQKKQQDKRQLEEAYKNNPWLNPKSPDFNQEKFELVRDRLVRNKYTGVDQDLNEIASTIDNIYRPAVEATKKLEEEEIRRRDSAKKTASDAAGSSSNEDTGPDYDELRNRTKRGDEQALRDRINALTQ